MGRWRGRFDAWAQRRAGYALVYTLPLTVGFLLLRFTQGEAADAATWGYAAVIAAFAFVMGYVMPPRRR